MSENKSGDSSWDATLYQNKHAFVWAHGAQLLELLAAKPGEHILDLGCGTGQLTAQIAKAGAKVVGVDNSLEMVTQARANFPAEKFPDIEFEVADATKLMFERPFDAVFSNAVLHWVKPASEAALRMFHSLRPGGRLVVEFGGHGNVARVVAAIHAGARQVGVDFPADINPWYYPSIGQYAGVLERAGFDVVSALLFDRPTELEGADGLANWIKMFGRHFVAAVPAEKHEAFFAAIEQHARQTLYCQGVWYADYRRLRIVARRPE
jgi:trans-aconitate 2-methyltransferase